MTDRACQGRVTAGPGSGQATGEATQQCGQPAAVVGREPGEHAVLIGVVVLDRAVDQFAALVGQGDQDPPTVVGAGSVRVTSPRCSSVDRR